VRLHFRILLVELFQADKVHAEYAFFTTSSEPKAKTKVSGAIRLTIYRAMVVEKVKSNESANDAKDATAALEGILGCIVKSIQEVGPLRMNGWGSQ
jgi:hypothetical protein